MSDSTSAVTINAYKKAVKKQKGIKRDRDVPATVLDRAREEAKNDELIEKVWGKLQKKKK